MSSNGSLPSTPITHVIFDLDGTLINSVDVLVDSLKDYANTHKKELSLEIERFVPNLTSLAELFQRTCDSLEINDKIDSTDLSKIIMKKVFESNFQLNPGVDRLIQHLRKHNIPMAIATGSTSTIVMKCISKFGDYFKPGINFDHIVCAFDDPEVVNKKPHPDVYIVCSKRFQTQPKSLNNVLIIEDSLTGIKGALNSGMRTLMVKDKRIRDSDITINTEITPVIKSFDEFIPQYFGLPEF